MAKIIRTPTRAEGGITPEEKAKMDAIAEKWIRIAFRADPIEPEKITDAIHRLYEVSGLKRPRVVIAPSPFVMAAAYGAAAAIWYQRKKGKGATLSATHLATDAATRLATDAATLSATHSATRSATRSATDLATHSATHSATRSATLSATDSATRSATHLATHSATLLATDAATRSATDSAAVAATHSATLSATLSATHLATDAATRLATDAATRLANGDDQNGAMLACRSIAGQFGVDCAQRWHRVYQGGNMWSSIASYLEAARDVLKLQLPEFSKYAAWEDATLHGGFRVMHEEFCIVSDFPEFIRVDEQNRPHCENGPSHKWRDGSTIYHWHGQIVPGRWIEQRNTIDPAEIIAANDVEQRAVGAEIIGWSRIADRLDRKIVDGDPDSDIGALIELTLPGLSRPGRFLQAICPRNGTIVEGVPRISDVDGSPIETAIAAQAWRDGLPVTEYQHPSIRT